jgi:sugar lactone lactonase YvrE
LVELRPDRVARYDELAATSPHPGPHTVPLRFPSLRRNRNGRATLSLSLFGLLLAATVGRAQAITEPVGTTSPVQSATLTITTGGTLGAINVLTLGAPNLDFKIIAGGTCAVGAVYAANQTCTVLYTLTPELPGARPGGISLTTSTGTLLASVLIVGVGTGPYVIYTGTAPKTIATSIPNTDGLTFDGAGNLFLGTEQTGIFELTAASGYTNSAKIAGSFGDPTGLVFDGNGNLFVTDTDYGTLTEVFAAGGYTATSVLASGLNYPVGVALDSQGNLFVADGSAVKEFTYASGYSTLIAHTNGLGYDAVAIGFDSANNLYVANRGSRPSVLRFSPSDGYTAATTLASGFNSLTSISIDAASNFVVSDDSQYLVERFLSASNYQNVEVLDVNDSFEITATDSAGNVYGSLGGLGGVVQFNVTTPPSLAFAPTPVGQTSSDSPQAATFLNNGNAPLVFSTPSMGTNPGISAGFVISNSSTCPQLSTSTAPASLAAGTACTQAVSFQPVAVGIDSGKLIASDNALNAVGATQILPLTGNGLYGSTATLTASPNPAYSGTAVLLKVAVASNPSSSNIPTGTVTFYHASTALGTVTLSGGVATLSISTLPAGPNNLTCVYPGDSNFPASNCATFTENIITAQAIAFPQPASPAYAGTTVALTATASSGLPVTYTVVSGPAVVSGDLLNYTGAGTVVIEADQAGNATYSAAAPVQDTVAATVLTEPIATTSASVSTLVTFATAGTLGSTHVFTQGIADLDFTLAQVGTVNGVAPCVSGAAYAVGQTCGIAFRFKPTRPGLRFGGIVLEDATGATLGNAYVYGLGTGPQLVYTPGVQSFVGSGYAHPSGAAVDASGNVYVSDYDANMVYEVPAGGGAQRSLGTFEQPDDVAVDGSGNVFVIYNRVSLAEIYAVNGVIPVNPTINVITSSLVSLNGMKVDGNGNIYLAASDSGGGSSTIQEVLAVNGSIPANPTILTLVSNVGGPTGVAVDVSGDVFFSDEIGNTAWEALAVNGTIPASPALRALATGLAGPSNIAVDAAGDVYVCEEGDVAELLAVNGSVPASPTIVRLGAGLNYPQGMAVDAGGDLYIADSGVSQIVKLDYTDAPSLTFATTLVGSTSTDSPQTVTFFNDGNAGLTFLPPGSGTNPSITAGYTFTSTCGVLSASTVVGYAVPPGASCAESISFKPVTGGVDSGALTLTDNDLNVSNAQQNIKLNATGTAAPTSLTLTSSANPANTLQPVTFTVRLNLSNGQAAGAGDAIQLTYSPNGTPIVVNLTTDATGSASYTVANGFAVGTYTIAAAFAGTNALQPSTASLIEVVVPPQDFALTANPPSITIKGGRHGTMTLTLTSIGLFAGQVHLGCGTPLPPYLTCELLGTETLTANGSVSFPFEMDTDQILNFYGSATQPQGLQPKSFGIWKGIALAMLLPVALAGFVRRRKLRGLMLAALLAVVATGLSACGDKYPQQTPVGTYTIPVIATGTTSSGQVISHTLDVTLTVTP